MGVMAGKKAIWIDIILEVFEKTGVPMSADEIWQYAKESKAIDTSKVQGKTPSMSINAKIYSDMRDNGENSIFVKSGVSPVRFFLRGKNYDEAKKAKTIAEITPAKSAFKEKDLHRHLTYFASSWFRAYTKTIRHEKSEKKTKGEAEWLHPDIVGVYSPGSDWDTEVVDLNRSFGDPSIKIYSFELKLNLNFSNLREFYFQAVSNSYWANEAYLVVAEIYESQEFKDELKRLSSLFGVGVIKLDVLNPDESTILYNALYKPQLDWVTVDKLYKLNKDFKEFINGVGLVLNPSIDAKNIAPSFEKICSAEELE